MLIQCTKKLMDELKIKPVQAKEENPLFCWHANLITVNHRKTVVLMNDSNLYRIILHGLKAKDFKNLDQFIVEAIQNTLREECIKSEIVEQFINDSPAIDYAKTKDRSMVARLNKACEEIYFLGDLMKTDKDRKELTGSIFDQLTDAFKTSDFCNGTKATFHELLRTDERDYPEEAVYN